MGKGKKKEKSTSSNLDIPSSPIQSARKNTWSSPQEEKGIQETFCCLRVKDYNENTSLHGPKYITEEGNHIGERILWIVIVIIAISLGCWLIFDLMSGYTKSPIVTTIDSTHHPISEVPFPAVTICPTYKTTKTKVVQQICRSGQYEKVETSPFKKNYSKVLEQVMRPIAHQRAFRSYHSDSQESKMDKHSDSLQELEDTTISFDKVFSSTIEEKIGFLKEVTPNCDDFLLACEFNGQKIACAESFEVIVTDYGFCCSFNVVPYSQAIRPAALDHWHQYENRDGSPAQSEVLDKAIEDSFIPSNSGGVCPTTPLDTGLYSQVCKGYLDKRNSFNLGSGPELAAKPKGDKELEFEDAPGSHRGLTLVVDSLFCGWMPSSANNGIKILSHNPKNFPEVGSLGMTVQPGTETFIGASASMTVTSEATRVHSPDVRDCYFPHEKELEYYKVYSKANCQIEMSVKHFVEKCTCKPYYMPGGHEICGLLGMQCVENATIYLPKFDQCRPACEELIYDATLSSAPLLAEEFDSPVQSLGVNPKYLRNSIAIVHVYFEEGTVIKYVRSELFTSTQIIANIGGILGLCMGFSFVSGIELVYFLTCRWLLRRRKLVEPEP